MIDEVEKGLKQFPSAQPETMYYPQVDGITPYVVAQREGLSKDDLISRQAAIDFIDAGRLVNPNEPRWSDNEVVNFLKSRPSAVVRCKYCKWWDQKDDSPYGYCHAMKHAYYSKHWEIGIYRTYKDDWFCADGERREDDPNT